MAHSDLYHEDFYGWSAEQAALLRAGRFDLLDTEHLATEIEGMSRLEQRELLDNLSALLASLLRWQRDATQRTSARRVAIANARDAVNTQLLDNPSLATHLPEAMKRAWRRTRRQAAADMGRAESSFPPETPWTESQILDEKYLPNWG